MKVLSAFQLATQILRNYPKMDEFCF